MKVVLCKVWYKKPWFCYLIEKEYIFRVVSESQFGTGFAFKTLGKVRIGSKTNSFHNTVQRDSFRPSRNIVIYCVWTF
jgi:hypothetical protein